MERAPSAAVLQVEVEARAVAEHLQHPLQVDQVGQVLVAA
jgi:hypothetical protein